MAAHEREDAGAAGVAAAAHVAREAALDQGLEDPVDGGLGQGGGLGDVGDAPVLGECFEHVDVLSAAVRRTSLAIAPV